VLKFIQVLFFPLAAVSFTCSSGEKNKYSLDLLNSDSVYVAFTKNLKSNLIPDSVFKMTSLKKLVIIGSDCDYRQLDKNGNDITQCWMIKKIPPAIGNLYNLDTLRLTLGAFGKFPREISKLQKLRFLDLTDSYMSDIDQLTSLKNLNQLLLYGCSLSKLPKDIGNLISLKFIGLAGNNLDANEINRIKKALPNCKVYYK
jgi:Leucine-rich repeat (LRR) protein